MKFEVTGDVSIRVVNFSTGERDGIPLIDAQASSEITDSSGIVWAASNAIDGKVRSESKVFNFFLS